MAAEPKRVTLVAGELLGYVRTGGLGTATTFLAVALARMGHRVEVLFLGQAPARRIDPEWTNLYESAGVTIRMLPRSTDRVEPSYFVQARDTERALRAAPPDVVITQDLAAPTYTAQRLRRLALDFDDTLFVVYCHGTRQWITDMARKIRVLPGALLVIPHLTRSAATGEPAPRAELSGDPIARLAFFGRLEERKGVRPFAAAVNALDPELLRRVELEFLGAATPAWPPERVEALLSETARQSLRRISFETELDQPAALARLGRPGTVAVLPSLEDNSPTAVYECLERGIPFIASDAGGVGELVAPSDRAHVLFQPTAAGVEAALRRALSAEDGLRAVTPAFDPDLVYREWAKVIEMDGPLRPRFDGSSSVDVVVVRRRATNHTSPCESALAQQSSQAFTSIVVDSREAGLQASGSEWIVFLQDQDIPKEDFVETLAHAQAASGADIVTCGLELPGGQHLFLGSPGALGLISNSYGTVALIRRSLLSDVRDPDWPLLAQLSLTGAAIVSVPKALVERRAPPAHLGSHPTESLLVVQKFEQQLPPAARSLARLAAGLAASSSARTPPPSRLRRALARVTRR